MKKIIVLAACLMIMLSGCTVNVGDTSPSPTPTAEPTPASESQYALAVEEAMHQKVNEIRVANGLNTLQHKNDLRSLSRGHSVDMDRRSFFSHTNPDGQDPFDRMRLNGIQCRAAGENILYNYNSNMDPEDAAENSIDQWMNSPGHRANILSPNYEEEGIGVHVAEDGRLYATQFFCTR